MMVISVQLTPKPSFEALQLSSKKRRAPIKLDKNRPWVISITSTKAYYPRPYAHTCSFEATDKFQQWAWTIPEALNSNPAYSYLNDWWVVDKLRVF